MSFSVLVSIQNCALRAHGVHEASPYISSNTHEYSLSIINMFSDCDLAKEVASGRYDVVF